jgi:hypothetical protein
VLSLDAHIFSDFEEFAFAVPGAISARTFILVLLRVSTELLKAHRQDYMYQNFDMLEVPLMHDDVREKFSAQIMCSWVYHTLNLLEINCIRRKDLLDNEVLVVFAHEL